MSVKKIAGLIAGLLIGISVASAQVLDNVEVTGEGGNAVIQARFSTPIQYVRHFPVKSGDTLQINLRIVPVGPNANIGTDSANERRTFRPAKLDGLPLRDVTYEGGDSGGDGPRLIVRFDRKTDYTVRTGRDQRSIIINVPLPAEHRDKSGSTFVINLATLDKAIARAPSLPDDLPANRVYLIPYSDERGTRYRLRLGFFDTPEDATAVKNKLKPQFPNASVSLTNASERDESKKFALAPATPGAASSPLPIAPPAPPKVPVPAPSLPPPVAEAPATKSPTKPPVKTVPKALTASDKSAEKLFNAGRTALAQGENAKAIDIFTEVLALPPNAYSADAHELLGLALERNKQIDLAKVEYRLYLKQYPDGEGAERVQQRLAILEPGAATKLTAAKNRVLPSDYQTYGTIAQNYYHGATKIDSTTSIGGVNPSQATFTQTDQSLLVTHADLVTRLRNERYDNRAVFNGDVYTDFLNHDKSGNRVSSAYLELADRGHTALARLGRQSGNSLGVLGRFDGALLGGNFLPLWRADFVVGKPVDRIAPDSQRLFAGAGLGLGPFLDRWSGNIYAIQQNVDGFVDRRAVGSELRYFDPTHTAFSLLDYDVYFNALNIAMLQGNWQATPATNLNLLLDYRKTPSLQLSNALISNTASSIKDLSASLSEQEMKEQARAQTANASTAVVGATHTLSTHLQLGGNVTYTKIGDTPVQQGTGNIFTYDTQLIANNVLFRDDVDVLSASYTDARDFQGTGLAMVTRMPLRKKWRVELGVRLYRQDNTIGTQLNRVMPSLKVDYRTARGLTFETEWGYERTHTTGSDIDETTGSTFFMVGWRVDF